MRERLYCGSQLDDQHPAERVRPPLTVHRADPDDHEGREDSAIIAIVCFAVMAIVMVAAWAGGGLQ